VRGRRVVRGVLLYVLLLGSLPFWGKSEGAILRHPRGPPALRRPVPLSEAAKDLIRSMLTRDPVRRLTAQAALGQYCTVLYFTVGCRR